ncbi:MAG: PocR ligand-binding domain-containing protein [Acidobacteria bacterium]|nr:PocR ligand-binding domain-containing protein [Acidobacteriota bacterium]MBS1866326.1 PocR ligand-binding domain-containing protein [Acidobacteriota bacterium]
MKKEQVSLTGTLKREFQRDLELFKHFLLLINDSGPIRNVELIWNEEIDPLKAKFKNRVGTEDALVQLKPAGSPVANRNTPSTLFCDLVHGFGSHEDETCAHSDLPAQQRCRATSCSQVYACHVGLTDIAVPVISDGQYLGTLFSGQVLMQAPSDESFERVRESLKRHAHIDMASLEAAYYQVPIVTGDQVKHMVRVLELFARYIANSWERLRIVGEHQRQQERELALDRKELASILLSGEIGDRNELKALAARTGLHRIPDRVALVQIARQVRGHNDSRSDVAEHMTLNRISHFVEDHCRNWPASLGTVVRPGEVCIFTSLDARNVAHERISLEEMAKNLMQAIRSQCDADARIGISSSHAHPAELAHAYQEACLALEAGEGDVSFYTDPKPLDRGPTEALEGLVRCIQRGEGVFSALSEFLAHAAPSDRSPARLQHSRALLTWAIEHIALEVSSSGVEQAKFAVAKKQAVNGVLNAPNAFAACESLRRFVKAVTQEVASTFCQRERKIVHAVERLMVERGVANLTIQEIANTIRVSSGHLSRVFRRTTGMTLENYLIRHRIELAKKMLLDPRLNVAEVSERCGFCTPAYFASVFRKYATCTPREFASSPQSWPRISAILSMPGAES